MLDLRYSENYIEVSEWAGKQKGNIVSIKCDDGEFRPIAYMSHSMTLPEQNYPIHDKEMLAIIKATEAWCHYLEATPYALRYIWTTIIYCTLQNLRT